MEPTSATVEDLRANSDVQDYLKEVCDDIPHVYSGTAGVFLMVARVLASPETFKHIRASFVDWSCEDNERKLKQSCLNILDGIASDVDIAAVNASEHPDDEESDEEEDDSDESDDEDDDEESEEDEEDEEDDESDDADEDSDDEEEEEPEGAENSGIDGMTRAQLKTRKDELTSKSTMTAAERKEYLAIVTRLENG